MSGLSIQYLLGIYFIVVAIDYENNKYTANAIKLTAGLILLFTAIFELTLLR